MSNSVFSEAAEFGANVTQKSASDGAVAVVVTDCALTPISGATLSP